MRCRRAPGATPLAAAALPPLLWAWAAGCPADAAGNPASWIRALALGGLISPVASFCALTTSGWHLQGTVADNLLTWRSIC